MNIHNNNSKAKSDVCLASLMTAWEQVDSNFTEDAGSSL